MKQPFLRQGSEPLFPEILWEKPINKRAAKKLLIIGGNSQHFSSVQKTYTAAAAAGIGEAKIVLPDSLKPVIGEAPDCLFVSSTRSGSLDRAALTEISAFVQESDGIILGGDLTKNPDTTVLLEGILNTVDKPVALSDEALALLPPSLPLKPSYLVVARTQTLFKRANGAHLPIEVPTDQSLLNKVAFLGAWQAAQPAGYILLGKELLVSAQGKCSLTECRETQEAERVTAFAMTFYLQHAQSFRALTTAAYELSHSP